MNTSDVFNELCKIENTLNETLSRIHVIKTDINNDFLLKSKDIRQIPLKEFFSPKYDFIYPQTPSILKVFDFFEVETVGDFLDKRNIDDLRFVYGIGKTKQAAIKSHFERYGLLDTEK